MPELGEITEVEVIKSNGERVKVKLQTVGVKQEKKPDANLEGQSGQESPAEA
jgi:hypothetical protein